MADVQLKDFDAITTHTGLANDDYIYTHDTSDDLEKKTLLSALKAFILGNKTVGGTVAGDIVDNNSVQTLTNKRLTNPKLNEDVALTATATVLNALAAVGSDLVSWIQTLAGYGGATALTRNTAVQTLTNKTLTTPKLNEDVALTATATVLNALAAAGSDLVSWIQTLAGYGGASALTINTAEQTLTNKTLTAPVISGGSVIDATILDPVITGAATLPADTAIGDVSPTELSYLEGTSSNLQDQIDAITGSISGNIETRLTSLESSTYNPLNQTYTYGYGFSTEALQTTLDRTQAQILTDLGLSTSSYVIDPTSIIAHLWQITAGIYQNIVLADGAEDCSFTTQTINSQLQMNTFKLTDLTAEKQYNLTLTLKVLAKAGV